ncbi:hypothetical protein GE061_004364 [Apolygus lucorum]|uniref:Uncharacterized protein n=1 Tax=Apolygus lucorum TaxID=248454 RepID=A0A8S9X0S6_APOLU|nr:hypothetical protein GE061_004364 [Apolygus lucorum]
MTVVPIQSTQEENEEQKQLRDDLEEHREDQENQDDVQEQNLDQEERQVNRYNLRDRHNINPPVRYPSVMVSQQISTDEPTNYAQAIICEEAEYWNQAVHTPGKKMVRESKPAVGVAYREAIGSQMHLSVATRPGKKPQDHDWHGTMKQGTFEQIEDIFTKPMLKQKFVKFRQKKVWSCLHGCFQRHLRKLELI